MCKYTSGVSLMLDKETVTKMGLYRDKRSDMDIEEDLLICINRAEGLIDEKDPLNECFSKVKKMAE